MKQLRDEPILEAIMATGYPPNFGGMLWAGREPLEGDDSDGD